MRSMRSTTIPRVAPPDPAPASVSTALAPTFDCRKARYPDEIAVCQAPKLARMDLNLAGLYTGLRSVATTRERRLLDLLDVEQANWVNGARNTHVSYAVYLRFRSPLLPRGTGS